MKKKGIQNSSLEQLKNDHETETAFKIDDEEYEKNYRKGKKKK